MKHSFNLVRPKAETSSIRLVVSYSGKKIQKCTGITVRTKLWNQKGRTPDKQCKDRDAWSGLSVIHARLVEKEVTARTRRDAVAAVAYALGEDNAVPEGRIGLWDYFKEWSGRPSPSLRFRQLAYARLSDIMGTDDDWEDIDGEWLFRFTRKTDALGYSHNYKSTLLSKFKTMMNEALGRGIHSNEQFKKFPTSYKTADAIALTQAEVDAIWKADLTGTQARARDCFIVGVYCAGRFQDYSKLSTENVSGGRLRYVQRKTGQEVVIPCSPRIVEVFSRNGGRVPKITEQEVGREIKKICKALGGTFLDTVEVRRTRGSKIEIEKHQRWEMCSTHTARRSGASILYKSGVPIRVCRLLTGHTNDTMFLRYVKVSKEEGADILAKSDFFK